MIGIYTDQGGTSCDFAIPPPLGTFRTYLVIKYAAGVTAAQFTVTLPPCSPYGISAWSTPFLSIGQPESGVALAFGGCVTGDFVAMQLDLQRLGEITGDCCALRLTAHPESITGDVEVVDCSTPLGQIHSARSTPFWLQGDDACAPMPAPSDPSPADGATDVALSVTLNCLFHDDEVVFSSCVPLLSGWVNVYFGTDSDPPLASPYGQFPMPRSLAPGTKYYWRVERLYGPARASSPVWSFTSSAEPNPVTTSTWGKIKALYR